MSEYQFKTTPYKHQLDTFDWTKDNEAHGILFEMGCGKSKVLVDTAGYLFEAGKIDGLLICAPKGAYQIWLGPPEDQILTHLPDRIRRRWFEYEANLNKKAFAKVEALMKPKAGVLDILTVNIESVNSEKGLLIISRFLKTHRVLWGIDESTCIGGHDAKRTKKVLKLRNLAKYRRILTGDSAPNSPLTMFSQLQFLSDQAPGHKSFFAFKSDYCNLITARINGRSVNLIKQSDPYKNLDRLREQVSKHCVIIKKKDCLDLPPKVYITREFDLSPEQQRHYDNMMTMAVTDLEGRLTCNVADVVENDSPAALDASASNISTASLVLAQTLRAHQIACGFIKTNDGVEHAIPGPNPRLALLLEILDEASGPVIIWANYRFNIIQISECLAARYGSDKVATYFGDTDRDDRVKAKVDFQARKVNYFVGNPSTAKYALTLTASNLAIYFSNSYDNEARAQSEDRNHRIGTSGDNVTYIDLSARGTFEGKIVQALVKKQDLSRMLSPSNWVKFITPDAPVEREPIWLPDAA